MLSGIVLDAGDNYSWRIVENSSDFPRLSELLDEEDYEQARDSFAAWWDILSSYI